MADTTRLKDSLSGLLNLAVAYLERTQEKKDAGRTRFSGEWPATINCEADTYVGKKGTSNYDSNMFPAAAILGILGDAYYRVPGLDNVPKMLAEATQAALRFQDGERFGFWHKFPLPFPVNGEQVETMQPSEFALRFSRSSGIPAFLVNDDRILFAAANLAPDLDDTAIAYTSIHIARLTSDDPNAWSPDVKTIGPIFSQYRNLPAMADEYLRTVQGMNSIGAFLTWFGNELLVSPIPDMTFKTRYLPYGTNDTDCVANANVLYALSLYGELDTPGVVDACDFVNESFAYGEQYDCGIYYPSPYNLHYAAARAYHNGVTCLKPAVDMAVKDIVTNQDHDGSWQSPLPRDSVHTSLYALNALLYSGKAKDPEVKEAIGKALRFVAQTAMPYEEGGCLWDGGVMFSAGKLNLRKDIVWRSDAYTTALAVEALALYIDIVE